jgi:hypothetical protein
MPADAVSAAMRLIISGHGGDAVENCAEFCSKWYRFMVNGEMVHQHDIWRDDCGSNFMAPQSGTWIYDRANWCPGNLVEPITENVPATVTPGSDFDVDLDFQSYTTSGSNPASYKLSATMFFYGPFNYSIDAALEEIISPSDKADYSKINPICGNPVVKVKNYGSETISTIQFEYGIEGFPLHTYTYPTSLASLQEEEVTLPFLEELNSSLGSTERFIARITFVNGTTDEETFNNELSSLFAATPIWYGLDFKVHFKMSGTVPGGTNNTNWKIIDVSTGEVLFNRNGTTSGTNYYDTVRLENGCYKLEVENARGYGLSFFGAFSSGFIRMYNLSTGGGERLPIPNTDLGASGLEGNFGNGFVHYFRVDNSFVSAENINESQYSLEVYPNPAQNVLNIDVLGSLNEVADIRIYNMVGQMVHHEKTNKHQIKIITEHLASGMYMLEFKSSKARKMEKITINH